MLNLLECDSCAAYSLHFQDLSSKGFNICARGRCAPLHSTISARLKQRAPIPNPLIGFKSTHAYYHNQKPLLFRVRAFGYGSEGGIRTLDTWIMIPPL